MNRVGSLAVAAICATALVAPAYAQRAAPGEYRPVLTVSAASYSRLLGDVQWFVDARLMALAAEIVGRVTGVPVDPQTLAPAGLDPRRPWGLLIETDGRTLPKSAFLPATDLARLLAGPVAAGKLVAPVGGVYELPIGDSKWYLTQHGAWGIAATDRDDLKSFPRDPLKLLAGLGTSHDLAARLLLKNLPADVQEGAARWLKEGYRLIPARKPGESDLDVALRTALLNEALRWAAALADEGETLTAGLSLDQRTRGLVLDLEQIVRPGTSASTSLAAPSRVKTDFSGFLIPTAALSGVWTGEIARMPLHRLLTVFDAVVSQLVPAGPGEAAALWQTVRDALLEEDVDGGAAVLIHRGGVTLAVGGNVADGAKLEAQLRKLAAAAGGGIVWDLDKGRYQDVRLHACRIPLPADIKHRAGLAKVFGESLDVVVGVGAQSLYVVAGRNPTDTLKQVMRSSKAKVTGKQSPVQFHTGMGPLLKLLAELEGGQQTAIARMSAVLEQAAGRDQVRLTARPITRGISVHLEVEEGMLRALTSLLLPALPAR